MLPGVDVVLRGHAEAIRDPVDVVEVADDLRRVVDGPFAESVTAQDAQVYGLHLAGS